MKNLYIYKILQLIRGVCFGNRENLLKEVKQADIDSRKINNNGLFFAIKGKNIDPHIFIQKMMNDGKIICAIGDEPYENVFKDQKEEEISGIYIKVKNVNNALLDIAAYYRSRLNIKVIGITGSVGKTGTKELIASILSKEFNVHKTEGNYNNEIGVPLTILGLRDNHEIAVIEMGINGFSQMSLLASIVRPDIMIITNIGHSHLEYLKNRKGVLKAKTEAFDYLKIGGKVILNADDDMLFKIKEVKIVDEGKLEIIRPLFFGIENKEALLKAENISMSNMAQPTFIVKYNDEKFDLNLNLCGRHNIYNALAAIAVGKILGLNIENIVDGFKEVNIINGRFKMTKLNNSINIIDDAYNANPESMIASLKSFNDLQYDKRKIAIIGDMLELGDNSKKLHKEIAEFIVKNLNIDMILLVGKNMLSTTQALKSMFFDKYLYFENVDNLIENLDKILKKEDFILLKASHSMNFDRIKKYIEDIKSFE